MNEWIYLAKQNYNLTADDDDNDDDDDDDENDEIEENDENGQWHDIR